MALRIIGSILTGASRDKFIDNIYMTDSEAAVAGRGYYLASGRWTKSATTAAIEAVCVKSADAGTDVLPIMAVVKTGDIIEANYTGTADAAFLPGLTVAILDSNGDNVDAATVTGGHGVILEKDTVGLKVRMIVKKNFTEAS